MIMACSMISSGTGFLFATEMPLTVEAPWTMLDQYATNAGVHSYANVAYLPFAGGTPADYDLSGAGGSGGVPNWETITFDFATSQTAPVQSAHQFSVGASVTFDAAPTPGNIIISYQFAEDNGGGSPPTGFTLIYEALRGGGDLGLNGISMRISYRCVEEGDTDTYTFDGGSFTHHTFMSEWALTA